MKSAKLLALACIAYQERQFEDAGRLFSASMESEDCKDALFALCESMDIDVSDIEEEVETMITESSANVQDLSSIVSEISESMADEYASVAVEDEEELESSSIDEDGLEEEEGTRLVIKSVSSVVKHKSAI